MTGAEIMAITRGLGVRPARSPQYMLRTRTDRCPGRSSRTGDEVAAEGM